MIKKIVRRESGRERERERYKKRVGVTERRYR